MFQQLKLLIHFYRSFLFYTILVTIICCWLLGKEGYEIIAGAYWCKALSYVPLLLLSNNKRNQYYFYKNLGLSKQWLWSISLILDFSIFIISSTIILYHA